MIKRLLAGVIAAGLLLLSGCGADARHEVYRVHKGQSGDWSLEVRRWVEYNGFVLLPNHLTCMDSESYTYLTWRLEYHGTGDIDDCNIVWFRVDAQNMGWEMGDGTEELGYYDFEYGWTEKDRSPGIELYDDEDCYALLTDRDGKTIRIDAPLVKSKGNKM